MWCRAAPPPPAVDPMAATFVLPARQRQQPGWTAAVLGLLGAVALLWGGAASPAAPAVRHHRPAAAAPPAAALTAPSGTQADPHPAQAEFEGGVGPTGEGRGEGRLPGRHPVRMAKSVGHLAKALSVPKAPKAHFGYFWPTTRQGCACLPRHSGTF